MKLLKKTLIATALIALAPAAIAGTDTENLEVSIVIENSCTIATTPLVFPQASDLTTAINGATTVSVTCTGASPISIGFGTGAYTAGNNTTRRMTLDGGSATIDYTLYTDSSRSVVAGDGTNGSVISATSTGSAQSFDVYGRVFASQNPKPKGTYKDTVVATVSF